MNIQNNPEELQEMIQNQEFIAGAEFKNLPGEELLGLWEHLQGMEMQLRARFGAHSIVAPNYEKLILEELSSRLLTQSANIFMPKAVKTTRRPRVKRKSPAPLYKRA